MLELERSLKPQPPNIQLEPAPGISCITLQTLVLNPNPSTLGESCEQVSHQPQEGLGSACVVCSRKANLGNLSVTVGGEVVCGECGGQG